MVINTNLEAQVSINNLQASSARLSKSLARLSSGSKIINPSDDAGGVAVGTRLDAQIHRLRAASYNVNNALSFVQTQDGYLKKIAKALDRMGELSILAYDGTKTDADRALYDKEFSELKGWISSAAAKEFNGLSLFSANPLAVTADSEGGVFSMTGIPLEGLINLAGVSPSTKISDLPTGSTTLTEGTITLTGKNGVRSIAVSGSDTLQTLFDKFHQADDRITGSYDVATGRIILTVTPGTGPDIELDEGTPPTGTNFLTGLGMTSTSATTLTGSATTGAVLTSDALNAGASIATTAAATVALENIKAAINTISSNRASIGAYQARLNYTSEQLTVSKENLTAASSRIQDVDVAEESTEMARENILVQSGTAMLAQANQLPQQVMRLLQ